MSDNKIHTEIKNTKAVKITKDQIAKTREFFSFKSMGFKTLLAVILGTVIIGVVTIVGFQQFSIRMEENLILTKLKTDVNYLEDVVSDFGDYDWNIQDGMLYMGNVPIGDGTEENANLEPFYIAENKTGTFVYVFMRCSDEGLEWTGDSKTGYMQGHYIRVAGTTLDPNGNSIIGTYIDKKVADVLDANGEYSGQANVAGGQIYCYYTQLLDQNGNVVGAMVVGRSMSEILTQARAARIGLVVVVLAILVGIIIAMFVLIRRMSLGLVEVEKYIEKIGNEEIPEEPLQIKSKDEVGFIATSVNKMAESLKEKQRMGAELSVASDIQANLLPKLFPPFPDRTEFDMYASMNPAKEVGGDLYDFFMVDVDHMALVIADVSGKGVPAALFMVTAKTLIKDHGTLGLSVNEIFTKTNKLLCEGNDAGLFVTGWMGIIELSTGKVEFANAGHNPPVIWHDGECSYLKSKAGFVLGGMSGITYKKQEFQMQPGDMLYLYTDGITEATNINNELYGEDRLLNYIKGHVGESMQQLCIGIKKDVDDFTGEAPQFDDETMVAFHYLGTSGKQFIFETDATIENIPAFTAFIDEKLEEFECSMKAQVQIDVAIDEIASNIAHYAYQGNDGFLRMKIHMINDQQVAIKFIDGGMPYNPLEKDDPDVTLSAEDRAIGGLGIFIVKQTMDDVLYKYANDKNILTLIKTIK